MKQLTNIDFKRQACLFGGAIGDAFGYEVEFNSLDTIKRQYGKDGLVEPVLHNGKLIVSDDTQMTLFTLEAINDCDALTPTVDVVERIRLAYLDWFNTQRENPAEEFATGAIWQMPELQHMRAPGNCCMTSLGMGGPGAPETPINDNKGCGGVMRVAPIGLFPQKWNPNEVFDIAMRAAAITHTHPTGYLSAAMFASIIRFLVDGKDTLEAIDFSDGILASHRGYEETQDIVSKAIDLSKSELSSIQAIEILGQGWIAEEALAIAIFAVLRGTSFKEVVRIAANHSGDSDSTASISGQLYGAARGMEDIPVEWVKALDVYPVIKELLF